ncbi:recombinase RecB, partial [Corynebacterium spheniscorum]
MAEQPPLNPADLVGCRYRQVQKRRYPELPPTPAQQHRHQRSEAARHEVYSLIPYRRALGDPRRDFRRLDLEGNLEEREFATLEALAAGVDIITSAVLSSDICDSALGQPLKSSPRWLTEVDVLLRISPTLQPLDAHATTWSYLPISISNHRVARPNAHTEATIIPTARLGLGKPLQVRQKIRHHTSDSYRLYLAQEALKALGLHCGQVGMIGQDRSLAFITGTPNVARSVHSALQAPAPTRARRVREC